MLWSRVTRFLGRSRRGIPVFGSAVCRGDHHIWMAAGAQVGLVDPKAFHVEHTHLPPSMYWIGEERPDVGIREQRTVTRIRRCGERRWPRGARHAAHRRHGGLNRLVGDGTRRIVPSRRLRVAGPDGPEPRPMCHCDPPRWRVESTHRAPKNVVTRLRGRSPAVRPGGAPFCSSAAAGPWLSSTAWKDRRLGGTSAQGLDGTLSPRVVRPDAARWNACTDRGNVPLVPYGRRILERLAGPRAVVDCHIHARCSTWNGAAWSCNRWMTVHSGVPPSLSALSRLLASVASKRDRRHVVCGVPSSPLEVAVGDTTRHVRTVVPLLGA